MRNPIIYRRHRACFYCGTIADQPCAGHETGGVIDVDQVRPWAHRLGLPWVFPR